MVGLARRLGTATMVAAALESARRARTHQVSEVEEQFFRAVNNVTDRVWVPVWLVMQSGSLAGVFVSAGHRRLRGDRQTALEMLIAGVFVWGGVKVIKPQIGRGRPARHLVGVSVRGEPQTGLGYPSGHAAVATTLAVVSTRNSSRPAKFGGAMIAGLTGSARIYAGAHLPFDVVGGTALGVLCGRAFSAILPPIVERRLL